MWAASGIKIQAIHPSVQSRTIRLTGKISLNEDRVAHIYPMVEGAVSSVHVRLGQVVKKDDLLVVIHSREIGQSKLELYQARLLHQLALAKDVRM
ncbi:MAG: efflux RND transporter periplasmic adaptor subunit, partial [Pirellulaceae bacterium]|nr:efflux RND transporter periplasmic adaptor subunit [Pirellulaceae bacterium]